VLLFAASHLACTDRRPCHTRHLLVVFLEAPNVGMYALLEPCITGNTQTHRHTHRHTHTQLDHVMTQFHQTELKTTQLVIRAHIQIWLN